MPVDINTQIAEAIGLQQPELRLILLELLVQASSAIADGSVTTAKLADLAVTTAKLADVSVTVDKMAVNSVASAAILDGAVTAGKLAATALAGQDAGNITTGTFDAARIPTLAQSKITSLTTDLAAKLTAAQGTAQADSTATDVAGLVTDFNALLAKLRTANIIAT